MNAPKSYFLLLFFCCAVLPALNAQELVSGAGFGVGRSWEVRRSVINTEYTSLAGVEGAGGFEISGFLGYRVGQTVIAFRPALLLQQATAYRNPPDDAGMSFRRKAYPATLALPVSASLFFGRQRFRPVLSVGGGFLVALTSSFPKNGVRPEPILPYVDVAVGVDFKIGAAHLRPELTIRNGTGEMFRNITNEFESGLAGQRWGYACFGIVLTN